MNKKIVISSVLVVSLVAAHAAFWVYQSGRIKFSIEQAAGKISKEVGRKNTEFFYASSEISGYPINFTVRVNQPKFITAGAGEKLELTSADQPLIIISNLFGSSYTVKLPEKIDVKQTKEDEDKFYKLEFAAPAQFEASFRGDFLFDIAESQEVLSYLSDKLKSFNYKDSGYTLVDSASGAKLSTASSTNIQVTKTTTKTNAVSTSYNINVQNVDNSALFALTHPNITDEKVISLWPVTAHVDFSSIDSKDANGKSNNIDYVIRDLDIKAASFGVNMKGDIKANGSDIFPFGDLSVKINNYQNLVDYFGVIVSGALSQTNIPLFHLNTEKSVDFKKVLYEIATEKSNEEKDILLTLSRQQGKSLFIGQKGLLEVIDLIKASANPEPVRLGEPAQGVPLAPLPVSPRAVAPNVVEPTVVPQVR